MVFNIHSTVRGRLPVSRLKKLFNNAWRLYGGNQYAKNWSDEFSVVFVGDKRMRNLNRQYRNQDGPTDVLSFDYGEIVICYSVASRQAREHKVTVASELCLLFVHGFLHLVGFDHQRPSDLKKMKKAEKNLLNRSGLIEAEGHV